MKVNGSLGNNMERVNTFCWMARLKWGSGRMVRELNGWMNRKMLLPKTRIKNESAQNYLRLQEMAHKPKII